MRVPYLAPKDLIFAFILFIAFGLATPPSAVAQPPDGAIPPEYFGLHTTKTTIWPAVPFGAFRLWDTQNNWYQLCTGPSRCDFTNLDRWIAQANGKGITDLVYTFARTPQWASSNPNDANCTVYPGSCSAPSDLNPDGTGTNQMWKDYVRAIASHVGNKVQYWEIWNEPHNSYSWTGTHAQMIRMARDARAIILSLNPNAKIVSPSGTPKWMKEYLAAGGGDTFDIANLHTYPGAQPPEYMLTLLNNEMNALAMYGLDKPVWADEGSWGNNALVTDANGRAAFVARAYLLHWSAGAQRFYWYSYANGGIGTLWTSTAGIAPAGTAYAQVYDWMVGATMSEPCAADDNGTTWTCELVRNSGAYEARVVWNTSGNTSYQAPSEFVRYRDLAGRTVQLPANGAVTIGIQPIILETGSPDSIYLPPNAALRVTPDNGYASLTVTADASASTDPNNKALSSEIDFGDGSVATAMTASHTYHAPGTYTVTANVSNAVGLSASSTATVVVTPPPVPVALLAVNPPSGYAPVTVTADSSASYENGGSIASRTIDFGDGSAATSVTASHTYATAGTYTVTLTITDARGTTATATSTVTVAPPPVPVAVLSVTPQTGFAPVTATADSSASYENGGSIASRVIDFGDGSAPATSVTASHVYAAAGTYIVTLTVTDFRGTTATATSTVTVAPPPVPVAVLAVTPQSGLAPVTVTADSSASYENNGSIVSRVIDFGDGSAPATSVSASHVYAAAGTYVVTLTITDARGTTATDSSTVTVTKPTAGQITIVSPAAGSTVGSPFRVQASIADTSPVTSVTVYINGVVRYQGSGKTVDFTVSLSAGSRNMTIQARNQAGIAYSKSSSFTVK